MSNFALIQDAGGWWQFTEARQVISILHIDEVVPALAELERRVNAEGLWAAGFVAYEASAAFDPALRTRRPTVPLLCMGLFGPPRLLQLPPHPAHSAVAYSWQPSINREVHGKAVARIRELIAAGDTYQVNYTFRLHADAQEHPMNLFRRMVQENASRHGAYLDCGRFVVCSASPELFFSLDGRLLTSRPMKGTVGRGLWDGHDDLLAGQLAGSHKDRAENLMITDMVRNDAGRVADTGSVCTPRLFELERYPSVWQMTSTVTAQTSATVVEIMRALFPAASITGAPKVRAASIIADMETEPRGVYTGAIGYMAPGRLAKFSVAIRTAVFDRERNAIEYGVGSGIVWDSTSDSEYEESLLKARIVTDAKPAFCLLETLLWEPGAGYFLMEEHLRRLLSSAGRLGVPADAAAIRERLEHLGRGLAGREHRVRLLVDRDGAITCESAPLVNADEPVRLRTAAQPVDPADPFLYNKTTFRTVYETAKAARPDCDDVILWNPAGEATETTIANLVVELNGRKLTPPVECGLLPGVYREFLLARGEIHESRIRLEDLRRASRIWVANSVRRLRPAWLLG